jgi:acyl-CoA thioesterase I
MSIISPNSPPRTTRRAALVGLTGLALPAIASAQARPSSPAFTLVVFGDSITAGYGLKRSEAFPARLEARLKAQGYQVRVVNAGLSGDTSAGGLARFDFAVPRAANGVLIAIGANDMLRGLPPAAAQSNIDAMIARALGRRTKVALTGMRAPSNWGTTYRRQFDGLYQTLAQKHRVPLDPFLLEGIALNPRLNQADGIHPTAMGADMIAARLLPFVVRSFGLVRSTQSAANLKSR